VSTRQRDLDRLRQRRDALLQQLRGIPNLMRGTLYEPQRKCGRATCTCASGGPRHVTLRLNVTLHGRTRTRFVRQAQRPQIEAMVAAYRRWWVLVDELTEVNLALLNTDPPARAS
jgi:hypothetical protein